MAVLNYLLELVAFAIVLWVLWRYMAPRMRSGMAAQQERIRTQLAESRLAKERLECAEQEARQALEESRTEAAEIREQAQGDAAHIAADLRDRAQEESDRIIARADQQLSAERDALVRQLRADVGRVAVELAGRVCAETLQEESLRERTVGRVLAGISGLRTTRAADERTAVSAGEVR